MSFLTLSLKMNEELLRLNLMFELEVAFFREVVIEHILFEEKKLDII